MKPTFLVCTLVLLALTVLSVTGESPPGPREATCSERSENGMCPRILKPVCGTDGETYDNECLLCFHNVKSKENVKIRHNGKCATKRG